MEHELEALKTEFAEYKVKQEADFKTEIESLKELIRDLQGDVGEIMSMHDEQEEDLNSRLDCHRFDHQPVARGPQLTSRRLSGVGG